MPEFTSRTLALTDDAYDREMSDDGHSRYGAYLRHNASQLHDDGQPLNAAEFACAAWRIATSPVMSPGYVRIRPDLHDLEPVIGYNYELLLRITVPLRHGSLAHRPARLGDWQSYRTAWDDIRWTRLVTPEGTRHPVLLATATLLIPVPDDDALVTPTTARPGHVMTREAKQAVKAIAAHANASAHLVADLLGGAR